MSDKLMYLKNVLESIEELEVRHKDLKLAKEQISLNATIDVEGEVKVGNMRIPLNELGRNVPPAIASNFRMVLNQYVDYLIQGNAEHQQNLLANIQIAHLNSNETNYQQIQAPIGCEDVKKNWSNGQLTETKSFLEQRPPLSFSYPEKTEQKALSVSLPVEFSSHGLILETKEEEVVQQTSPLVLSEVTASPVQEKEENKPVESVPQFIEPSYEEAQPMVEKDDSPLVLNAEQLTSSRILDKENYQQALRKLIAQEFYKYKEGDIILPEEIQEKVQKKTGKGITLEEINDLAWNLIAQDVLIVKYRTQCMNGHSLVTDYIDPPLPKKVHCSVCKHSIRDIDICFYKLPE
ncbi:hypothetical protein PP175_25955 (plasmid) [Aneurinibacillus sp. Ricciae_BoGa-3]|uniref:hypothetical protein n=1 Tax=Aneurinibacillus sp. Ricciae_BoGa-3 TaxID=3022697 RepID=UPI00233F7FDB|nr:hypothetical protein [Aneurinibacillus sp. Ricciae_BoGa-3]WCK57514.1 hypothetical protein PP175_25955 [Aneurinibacillus sp. Ricciae_BoGa-3]